MSPSEEEERKEQTSLPSLPSDTRRSKAGLQVSEERSEVAANKEVEQSEQGALMCGFQGESGGGLEPVEFSEQLGEAGGDQEEFSQQVQGLILGLEEISQQPFDVASEVEDNEVNFQLSNELAQQLERIEEDHCGGLLNPDISGQTAVLPGEGSDSDQVLPPVQQKLGGEDKKRMMLAKLADDLMLKRKVMENENTTLEDQDAMTVSKVNEDNNNKVKIIMDVKLDRQETKQFSMEVDPLRRTKKAMKAVASRLGKEVSSLKFLVER